MANATSPASLPTWPATLNWSGPAPGERLGKDLLRGVLRQSGAAEAVGAVAVDRPDVEAVERFEGAAIELGHGDEDRFVGLIGRREQCGRFAPA